MREHAKLWFVVWTCKCSDVKGSLEALDRACPHHEGAEAMEGSPCEITPGVSTNLGHICDDGQVYRPAEGGGASC